MADRDALVEQFIAVTGAEANRARFYLESAAWNVEIAISHFFEGGDDDQADAVDPVEEFEEASMPTDPAAPQTSDPPSRNKHGAEEKKEDDDQATVSRPSFVGAGYRLGETPEDTQVVAGHSRPAQQRQVDKKLKLWKNGFSIDDGPLRDFNNPENKLFLDSIAKGEVPQELIREAHGGEVNLDMEDHRTEEFVKPKVKVKAFSGAGHMLGSPAPAVTSSAPPAGDRPAQAIQVDDTKPVTNVQLRLADGKRLVLKLNHSHRVSDIRQHIMSSNPQYAQANFCLMTTFPNKELTDETQTIEEAKLINAVVVQRMK
ncbi:hypothetical protein ElyMa_002103400 [Elysia marginata]|uniref:P97 cofactor p47 n=1 Tax=Elysia marginata TaxID=1093978 RepID=A0AAV4FFS2_9GAST|nr:hypothetical protein ElyMa_002103400 [Elysia marginata]